MKKLFHLGMIACIVITISSCSKSRTDLVATEKASKNEHISPSQGMNPISESIFTEGGSTISDIINQPISATLGDPDVYLQTGTTAVFYVLLDDAFATEPVSLARLTIRDDLTGGDIMMYSLRSSDKAAAYGINVPAELDGRPFMFAVVDIDEQYTGRTIALHSEVSVNKSTTIAQFDHAFSVPNPD